jgi:GntP family gluconate:H+ symporter
MNIQEVVDILQSGFGSTLASIGLIILLGATLGEILNKSGATHAIAEGFIKWTGKDNSIRAISVTGFVAGIPIFCDSGFIVLSSLSNKLAQKSNAPKIRMAVSLAIVMFVMHCLIPPHPGITAAAGMLSGKIGQLVILGIIVAIPTIIIAYLWIKMISKRIQDVPDNGENVGSDYSDPESTPKFFVSLLPILLPLLLIISGSLINIIELPGMPAFITTFTFLGHPVMALFLAVCMAIIIWPGKKFRDVDNVLGESIVKAGPILAITAAGGMFGSVIKTTGAGTEIATYIAHANLGLFLPFILAFILKTAQGSSTVAAITTASILTTMLDGLGLSSEWGRLFALLAIGSGSMAISHANDSYFWVVSKFSGIESTKNLKVYSSTTIVVSITSFLVTWLLSIVFM